MGFGSIFLEPQLHQLDRKLPIIKFCFLWILFTSHWHQHYHHGSAWGLKYQTMVEIKEKKTKTEHCCALSLSIRSSFSSSLSQNQRDSQQVPIFGAVIALSSSQGILEEQNVKLTDNSVALVILVFFCNPPLILNFMCLAVPHSLSTFYSCIHWGRQSGVCLIYLTPKLELYIKVLIFISLFTIEVGKLLMYLLAVCIFLFVNCVLKPLALFLFTTGLHILLLIYRNCFALKGHFHKLSSALYVYGLFLGSLFASSWIFAHFCTNTTVI